MTNSDSVRHRLYYSLPKSVPPFDSALVDLDKKGMLKLLLSVAPPSCQIVTVGSHSTRYAKLLPMLFRKNFRLINLSLEYSNDLYFTGRVFHLFVRKKSSVPLSPLFFRGASCLHEISQSQGTVVDLYVGGLNFHEALKDRLRIKESVVVLEEQ